MDLRRWHETIAAEFAMTVRTNPIPNELPGRGRGMALTNRNLKMACLANAQRFWRLAAG
jgi:hypothetical protein